MKEVTRIITTEITCIEKVTDAEYEAMLKGKEAKETFKNFIMRNTNADDVQVNVQDFVMEEGEPVEEENKS